MPLLPFYWAPKMQVQLVEKALAINLINPGIKYSLTERLSTLNMAEAAIPATQALAEGAAPPATQAERLISSGLLELSRPRYMLFSLEECLKIIMR